jgi:FkbM family methyltransferase
MITGDRLGPRWEIDAMSGIRAGLRDLFRRSGHDLASDRALDLAESLKEFQADPKVVFDVGAYKGESTRFYRESFPGCEVHAFEPDLDVFKELSASLGDQPGVTLNNVAVGASPGPRRYFVNVDPAMNSLLEPGTEMWGSVARETTVDVITLDDYCAQKGIASIGLLKTDTQGFDLEVLKGAAKLMDAGQVRLVLTEILFADQYKEAARIEDIFRFMRERGYKFSSFYNWHFRRHAVAGFCDALFLHPSILPV